MAQVPRLSLNSFGDDGSVREEVFVKRGYFVASLFAAYVS